MLSDSTAPDAALVNPLAAARVAPLAAAAASLPKSAATEPTAARSATAKPAAAIFVVMLVPLSGMQRPGQVRPYAPLSGQQLLPRWGL